MSQSQTAGRVGNEPFPASIFWLSSLVSQRIREAAASLCWHASVTEKPCVPDHPVCLPEEPAGWTIIPTLPAAFEDFGSLKNVAQPGQSRSSAIVPEAKPWPRSSQR